MLSRRNVRVKIMQMLFTLNRDEDLSYEEALKKYRDSVRESFELFLFNIYNIAQITSLAVEDGKKRKTKHLPSDYDKAFTPKIYDNPLIQSIVTNESLTKDFEKRGFEDKIDKDYCKKIYFEFAKEEPYKAFIQSESGDKEVLDILLELFRFCRKSELFCETMEDNYNVWFDDKSLVVGTVKKYLKTLPCEDDNEYMSFYPERVAVADFGEKLFDYVQKNDKDLLEYISPTLENWDHERVAVVDMILLKMAVTELMNFPTIPPKVTLNEYVEVSKNYSTAKSKDFINGVLDKLLERLKKDGKISKEGRGLVE